MADEPKKPEAKLDAKPEPKKPEPKKPEVTQEVARTELEKVAGREALKKHQAIAELRAKAAEAEEKEEPKDA